MACCSRPNGPPEALKPPQTSLRLPICACPSSNTCPAIRWRPQLRPSTACLSIVAYDVKFHTKRHRALLIHFTLGIHKGIKLFDAGSVAFDAAWTCRHCLSNEPISKIHAHMRHTLNGFDCILVQKVIVNEKSMFATCVKIVFGASPNDTNQISKSVNKPSLASFVFRRSFTNFW